MAKRRGMGEGTITQRADGRWMARVQLERGVAGKRRRRVVYGVTRADVSAKLNGLLGRSADGALLTTSTPTLARWLEDWYSTHESDWRPSTRRVYRSAIDQWLVPALGSVRLEGLKPMLIQRWINATKDGARQMVTTAHVVLRSALKWGMTMRVLTYNPAELVKVPRSEPTQPQPLTADQAVRLVAACDGDRLGTMVLVSLTLGLRVGEVTGLSWADVDLTGQTVRIRQQVQAVKGRPVVSPLKAIASLRKLALPAETAAALQDTPDSPARRTAPCGATMGPGGRPRVHLAPRWGSAT